MRRLVLLKVILHQACVNPPRLVNNDGSNSTFLRSIVNQAKYNEALGIVTQGEVIRITDVSDIRSSLTPWYSYFRVTGSGEKHAFATPYLDMFSKHGLVTSVCRPAYRSNILVGVACVEVKISDLFSDTTSFHENGNSYAFVIDQFGRTIKHPMLQLPRTIRAEKANRHIFTVEREMSVRSTLENMMRGKEGSVTVGKKNVKARGVVHMNGIIVTPELQVNISYIPIHGSPYSVAVVIDLEDTKVTVVTDARLPDSDISECFLYHQHQKYNPYTNVKLCNHYGRLVVKDKSIVSFNARAFSEPAYFLNQEWGNAILKGVTDYFTDPQGLLSDNHFKTGVKQAIQASYKLEKIWKERRNSTQFTIWQYFASTEGFSRVFPGLELSQNYDFETRPWFLQSKAQPRKTIIAPPYQDAGGAGWISGIYQTIYKTQTGTSHNEIAGVLAADISLQYLHYRLLELYPKCSRAICMLVDDSGFIVLHTFFIQTRDQEKELKNAHIVFQEQRLSQLLLESGIMDRRSCTDFDIKKIISWYYLEIKNGRPQFLGENEFEIHPIQSSNVFLIAKLSSKEGFCCSQKVWTNPSITPCPQSGICSCLCYSKLNICKFNIKNSISDFGELPPTCPSPTPDLSEAIFDDLQSDVPHCNNMQCTSAVTAGSCNIMAGCSWCEDHGQTIMAQPCCQAQVVCPWGVIPATNTCPAKGGCKCKAEQATSPPGQSTPNNVLQPPENNILIYAMAAVIVVLFLIILVFVILKCKKIYQKKTSNDVYLTATNETYDHNGSGVFTDIPLHGQEHVVQGESEHFQEYDMIGKLDSVNFKVTERHEIEHAHPNDSCSKTFTLRPVGFISRT